MASDFDEMLARAASERAARDNAEMERRRQHAENEILAHSIVDPYLNDLGPRAVAALRDLQVPTVVHLDRQGRPTGLNKDCWEFILASDPDAGSTSFLLHTSGRFGSSLVGSELRPVSVGIIKDNEIAWRNHFYYDATFWASPEDRKVLVSRKYYGGTPYQELSRFVAEYIHGVLRR